MKVIIDDKIPYIREAIAQVADQVVYLPGSAITAEDVRDADALIVRTRTKCNAELLERLQSVRAMLVEGAFSRTINIGSRRSWSRRHIGGKGGRGIGDARSPL